MIDNEHGDKSGVLIQWMSREFLESRRKDLTKIAVGPDEYCVLVTEGRVDSVSTQGEVEVPRLVKRFWQWGKAAGDVQIAVMDTGKHSVRILLEAYTRDRELICGTVSLMANIRPDDCVRALRLLKETAVSRSGHGYREFTVDD